MKNTMIIFILQICVIFLVLAKYLPLEALFLSLAIGLGYSIFSMQKTKRKALFIGHLAIIGVFLFWSIVPPYLFSN